MSYIDLVTSPQVWPFTIVLVLFFGVSLVEIVLFWSGIGNFGVELDLGVDGPDAGNVLRALDWLGVGRVPLLVTISASFLCFGGLGLIAQTIQFEAFGRMLPWPLVALGSFVLTLPLVRALNLGLSRIWPRDVESSAVSQDSFVGHEAEVALGTVSSDTPGQIKVRDPHGTTHHLLAFADANGESYETGSRVLIVARRGASYAVIRHPNPSS